MKSGIHIKKNNLSLNAKKSMFQRMFSAAFILVYILGIFIIGSLSDVLNEWSPLSQNAKIGLGVTYLAYVFILLPITVKEICNIFFKFSKLAHVLIFLTMLLLIYVPTLVYFAYYYFGLGISNHLLKTIFSSTLGFCIVLMTFVNLILLSIYKKLSFKNLLILTLLVGFVSGMFLGLYYFIFLRGWTTLLFLMLIVFFMDTFAYFGGIFFGKHKMSPKISPKKTWEGLFIGMFITICLMLLLLFAFSFIHKGNILENIFGMVFKNPTTQTYISNSPNNKFIKNPIWWFWIVVILIGLSVVSVVGDLFFSWFKRTYKIKDYGRTLPGHGGIIDRIDSHSFVLSFYFVISFMISISSSTIQLFPNIK